MQTGMPGRYDEMPDITVNGVDLYYEIHREGILILLVAGLASDSQSWPGITV
jgi:hypothetical protein